MYRFVTILAVVSCAFAGTLPDDLDGRIVNGVDTTIEKYPYQVSIQTSDGRHFCGGSIIDKYTIITASHCMQKYKASQIKIRLGTTQSNRGGEIVAVRAFRNHPKYNADTMVYDVSVIKMASPVKESSKIKYISLAEQTPPTGALAVVTGWGATCQLFCGSPTTLQEVQVDIVDQYRCSSSAFKYGSRIKETMLCAYAVKKDACQGDSGGPMVSGNKLVGIVSWGDGCARSGYPGVYCNVAAVHDWIKATANSL